MNLSTITLMLNIHFSLPSEKGKNKYTTKPIQITPLLPDQNWYIFINLFRNGKIPLWHLETGIFKTSRWQNAVKYRHKNLHPSENIVIFKLLDEWYFTQSFRIEIHYSIGKNQNSKTWTHSNLHPEFPWHLTARQLAISLNDSRINWFLLRLYLHRVFIT